MLERRVAAGDADPGDRDHRVGDRRSDDHADAGEQLSPRSRLDTDPERIKGACASGQDRTVTADTKIRTLGNATDPSV
jgi:hypothetical protein